MRVARTLSFAIAVLVGLGAVMVNAPAAMAVGDQLQDSAVTTYELLPARHVIHVTMAMTMTNKKAGTSSNTRCTKYAFDPYYGWYAYATTCVTRTYYYYNSWTFWMEKDATAVKAKASSGSATVELHAVKGDWRQVTIKYSPLYYGNSRKLTLSYDLPAGGPRSTAKRRAGSALASFCVAGPGTDSGEVRVVLPVGYEPTETVSMRRLVGSGGKVVLTSGRLKKTPWTFYSCVDGTNPQGSRSTPVEPAGGPVAAVSAWKDDPTWAAAAMTAASQDAPKLAAVLGGQPDGGGISIAETAGGSQVFDSYSRAGKRLPVGEGTVSVAAFDDLIAQTWFPSDVFADDWIKGGYVRWAESKAGLDGSACDPGAAPAGASGALDVWLTVHPGYSQGAKDLAEYKTEAACSVMAKVADAIGADRMLATIAAMRGDLDAWSPDAAPAKRDQKRLTWEVWLDIVTERGLIPAGADPDLAANLLVTRGVTTKTDLLAAHAKARNAYHDLGTLTGGKVPALIVPALATWDLETAQAALDAAAKAWTTAGTVLPTTLPGVTADGGPVQQAVTTATTQAELDQAVALADRQAALARDVAEAIAVEGAPRDALQQLGLVGTTLPDPAVAVAAVTRIDDGTATATADEIRATIGGARDVGTRRASLVAGVVVLLLVIALAFVLVTHRRRRRTVAGAVKAVAPLDPPPPPSPA